MTRIDPVKAAGLLAWTLVFAFSLAPFEFAFLPHRVAAGSLGDGPGRLREVLQLVVHLLVFAAVGSIEYFSARSRAHRTDRRVTPVLLRAFLFCASIELGQLLVASRHASLVDLCMNGGGFVLGYLGARAALPRLSARVSAPLPRLRSRLGGPAFLVFWAVTWIGVLLLPAALVSLRGWSLEYPLLIGNERGGERPWNGTIEYVAVYDRALSAEQVRRTRDPQAHDPWNARIRTPMGLLAAYDLTNVDRREAVPAIGTTDPALRLVLPAGLGGITGERSGLMLQDGATLATAGPAALLTTRITTNGAFSVEVWGRPASLSQTGPARIVGISDGVSNRNFTLGQEGDALSFRVRNGFNGPNGNQRELRVAAVLSHDQRQIVATYRDGVSTLYRDGLAVGSTEDMREPSFLLGLGARLGGQAAAAFLAALSLIAGSACFVSKSGAPVYLGRLLLFGYVILLVPPATGALFSFPTTMSVQIWFGPALVVSWIWLRRASRW